MGTYEYYNDEFKALSELLTLAGILLYKEDGNIRDMLDVFYEVKETSMDESLKNEIWKQIKIAIESLQ